MAQGSRLMAQGKAENVKSKTFHLAPFALCPISEGDKTAKLENKLSPLDIINPKDYIPKKEYEVSHEKLYKGNEGPFRPQQGKNNQDASA